MTRFIFLGTGPAGGNLQPTGKSRRLESSAMMETRAGNILLEVTQFFRDQCAHIKKLDAVLITHGHRDACGGIPQLTEWLTNHACVHFPVYTLPQTIKRMKEFFDPGETIDFHPIKPYHPFFVCGVRVIAIPVKHSMQSGFPTIGYVLETKKYSLVWMTDVAGWDKKAERYMRRADTLVIDTSIWKGRMPSHIQIQEMLPVFCAWKNKQLVLAHIGKTAPPHDVFVKKVKQMCPKAVVAYDGMILEQ